MSDPPKISFGFSKMKKKPTIIPPSKPVEKKPDVEFITTFEHRDPHAVEPKKEVIIPVTNVDGIKERILAYKRRKEAPGGTDSEIKAIAYENPHGRKAANVIPLNVTEEPNDSSEAANYDDVPVTEFGQAMLRGMGWAPGKGIGKKPKLVEYRELELRPRGLGLGAGPDAVMKLGSKKEQEKK